MDVTSVVRLAGERVDLPGIVKVSNEFNMESVQRESSLGLPALIRRALWHSHS